MPARMLVDDRFLCEADIVAVRSTKQAHASCPKSGPAGANTSMVGGSDVAVRFATVGGGPLVRYLHEDHLGSVAVTTDESGTVVERSPRRKRSDRRPCPCPSQLAQGLEGVGDDPGGNKPRCLPRA